MRSEIMVCIWGHEVLGASRWRLHFTMFACFANQWSAPTFWETCDDPFPFFEWSKNARQRISFPMKPSLPQLERPSPSAEHARLWHSVSMQLLYQCSLLVTLFAVTYRILYEDSQNAILLQSTFYWFSLRYLCVWNYSKIQYYIFGESLFDWNSKCKYLCAPTKSLNTDTLTNYLVWVSSVVWANPCTPFLYWPHASQLLQGSVMLTEAISKLFPLQLHYVWLLHGTLFVVKQWWLKLAFSRHNPELSTAKTTRN